MSPTSIDLNPSSFQVLTSEVFPFTVEWADLVGIGNAVSTPSAIMKDDSNGVATANGFVNNFGVNGTQAQYIVDGTKLQPGHTYTAILTVISQAQTYRARVQVVVPR